MLHQPRGELRPPPWELHPPRLGAPAGRTGSSRRRAATVGRERRRPRRRWWALRVLENAWGGNYQVPQRARGCFFVLWMERRHCFVQEKWFPPQFFCFLDKSLATSAFCLRGGQFNGMETILLSSVGTALIAKLVSNFGGVEGRREETFR